MKHIKCPRCGEVGDKYLLEKVIWFFECWTCGLKIPLNALSQYVKKYT